MGHQNGIGHYLDVEHTRKRPERLFLTGTEPERNATKNPVTGTEPERNPHRNNFHCERKKGYATFNNSSTNSTIFTIKIFYFYFFLILYLFNIKKIFR